MGMQFNNNAEIRFNGKIPDQVMPKLEAIIGFDECIWFDKENGSSVLIIDDATGDLTDMLNEMVDILHPYNVLPLTHEYNRYYGDADGYDVFDGDKFISMGDGEFGIFMLTDEQLIEMLEHRGYIVEKAVATISVPI